MKFIRFASRNSVQPMYFSIVIPLYNRPDELDELLESLCKQNYDSFEVIVAEDGSTLKGDQVVQKYADRLKINYFEKNNIPYDKEKFQETDHDELHAQVHGE